MPIAEAHSAYVLDDRASPAMRSIRQEAERLTIAATEAGEALDRVGDKEDMKRIDALGDRMRKLGTQDSDVMRRAVDRNLSHTEGSIRTRTLRMEGRLESLRRKMLEVGEVRASPTVELDGIVAARAQLALLNRELGAFGRRSPTARVGVTASGTVGGIGGGASRSIGAASGGGGRAASGAVKSIGVGPLNLSSAGGLAVTAAALPIAQSVIGAGGAGLATLGGAALGAGAIGAAGAGVAGAGIAGIMSIVKPAQQGLKDLAKAQEAYSATIRQYGRASEQAATARTKLNMAEAAAPAGGSALLQQQRGLGRDWRRLTQPGQSALLGGAAQGLGNVRSVAPTLAGFSNRIGQASGRAVADFSSFATSPQQMQTIGALAHEFARDIPVAERTAEHLVSTFGNIARAALPFFHEGVEFLEHWTEDWAVGTSDISATRRQIGSFVDDLKEVADVAGSAWDLTRHLLEPGRSEGRGMLHDLGAQLDKWDAWAQRNPGRIREFFHDGVEQTGKIAHFVGQIVSDLSGLATVLGPIVGQLAQLGSIAGGAGLLIPTALRMGVGGALGNRRGGSGGGAGGGGAAGMPLMFGGGGGAAAGAAGAAAGGGIGAGTAAAAGGVGYLAARTAGVAGRYSVGSGIARPEGFAQRYGNGAANARRFVGGGSAPAAYAMPESQLGARAVGFGRATALAGRAGTLARTGGMAAARFGLPVALIAGGMNAATLSGRGGAQRLQAFGSTLTMGNIPQPKSGAQLDESVQRYVNRWTGQLKEGTGPKAIAANVRTLETGKRMLRGTDYDFGSGGERERHLDDATGAFDEQIAAQRQAGTEATRSRRQTLNVSSRMRGAGLADSFQQGYGIERAGGIGRKSAFGDALDGTVDKMRKMRPAGAKVLGESMIAWANEMKKKSPELTDQVDKFVGRIERRFSKLGQHVQVVNGRILTGSTQEWAGIADAIGTPAEQARQRVHAAFTAIQREAVGSLRAMGYSAADARSIVSSAESITKQSDGKVSGASALGAAQGMNASGQRYQAQADALGDKKGDGWGRAVGDGVGVGDMATKGNPAPLLGGGNLMGANPGLSKYATDAAGYGLHVSSGRRPGAITNAGNVSYHSSGNALDLAGSPEQMMAFAKHAASAYGSDLEELIYSPLGWSIKNGQRTAPYAVADHYDHVHVADTDPSGGGAGGIGGVGGASALGGGGGGSVNLKGGKSGILGVAGAMADRASDMYASGLEAKINEAIAGGNVGGDGGTAPSGGDARALGRRMMLAAGFGADQWNPLNSLWTKESGWNPNAVNASSGAMGIPQALGHGNVFALGDAQAQIAWGLDYIKGRYGTPAAAWAHSQQTNWYGEKGGFPEGAELSVKRPTMIGVGDSNGGETVSVRKRRTGLRGSGGRSGGARVQIDQITIQVGSVGEISAALKRQVRAEVDSAFDELADEMENGVAEDEQAVIG